MKNKPMHTIFIAKNGYDDLVKFVERHRNEYTMYFATSEVAAIPIIADLNKFAKMVSEGDERAGLISTTNFGLLSEVPACLVAWDEMREKGYIPPQAWIEGDESGDDIMIAPSKGTKSYKRWIERVDRMIFGVPDERRVYSLWLIKR